MKIELRNSTIDDQLSQETTAFTAVEERVQAIMTHFSHPWRWFCDDAWIVLEPPLGIITAETMSHVSQHADARTVEAVFRATPHPGIYLQFRLRDSTQRHDPSTTHPTLPRARRLAPVMPITPRIYDLFKTASKIIVTQETHHIHASWEEAIAAPALKPERPTTRHVASPQIMLRGPFEADAELTDVIFYVGIGFIEVRRLDAEHCTYETTVIGGDGIEEREAFMTAARDLFFSDVRFRSTIHA